MIHKIGAYIIGSEHESDRQENIKKLKKQLPFLQYEEAVYPDHIKIPFLNQLKALSLQRTGHQLSNGELGCLLSHRKVWRKIVAQETDPATMFLVLESDSVLNDADLIQVVGVAGGRILHTFAIF